MTLALILTPVGSLICAVIFQNAFHSIIYCDDDEGVYGAHCTLFRTSIILPSNMAYVIRYMVHDEVCIGLDVDGVFLMLITCGV